MYILDQLSVAPNRRIWTLVVKWSTKTGPALEFSRIDFPIRLEVTHRYIRGVLVRCKTQRYSPLWREVPVT